MGKQQQINTHAQARTKRTHARTHTHIHTHTRTHRERDRQTERQTERQTDRQTDRQRQKQGETQPHALYFGYIRMQMTRDPPGQNHPVCPPLLCPPQRSPPSPLNAFAKIQLHIPSDPQSAQVRNVATTTTTTTTPTTTTS